MQSKLMTKVFMQNVFIVIVALILSACAINPTDRQATAEQLASIGEEPTQEMVQERVKRWGEDTLKDFESARWRFNGKPFKFQISKGWAQSGQGAMGVGWASEFEVNAKNSYGGYTGYKCYVILFVSNGKTRIETCGYTYGHPLFKRM